MFGSLHQQSHSDCSLTREWASAHLVRVEHHRWVQAAAWQAVTECWLQTEAKVWHDLTGLSEVGYQLEQSCVYVYRALCRGVREGRRREEGEEQEVVSGVPRRVHRTLLPRQRQWEEPFVEQYHHSRELGGLHRSMGRPQFPSCTVDCRRHAPHPSQQRGSCQEVGVFLSCPLRTWGCP